MLFTKLLFSIFKFLDRKQMKYIGSSSSEFLLLSSDGSVAATDGRMLIKAWSRDLERLRVTTLMDVKSAYRESQGLRKKDAVDMAATNPFGLVHTSYGYGDSKELGDHEDALLLPLDVAEDILPLMVGAGRKKKPSVCFFTKFRDKVTAIIPRHKRRVEMDYKEPDAYYPSLEKIEKKYEGYKKWEEFTISGDYFFKIMSFLKNFEGATFYMKGNDEPVVIEATGPDAKARIYIMQMEKKRTHGKDA